MTLLVIVAMLTIAFLLVLMRADLRTWTAVSGIALLLITPLVVGAGAVLVRLAWLAWLALVALNVARLRRRYVTTPVLALFRRLLPRISPTEQEALDAGSVWIESEIFSGRPDFRRLLDVPRPQLSDAERAFLDGPTERLCELLSDWDITHTWRRVPLHVWQFVRDNGFLSMIIPRRYGGLGFSHYAHSEVVAKISTRCGSAAVEIMVPNSLGPAELLLRYGTEAQKNHYLPRLARGREIPCFALTGPTAGSDAASIPDFGIVCRGHHEGEEVLGIRLTWDKRYITLAPVATLLGLAFRLRDPEHLIGTEEDVGITLALVPTTHPGVVVGRRHFPAGQGFMNGPTSGRDVFIPLDWVIGGRARCGEGWRMLMECLAVGRSISLPALACGAAKLAARVTGAYARVRRQFNLPIGSFEGVQEVLARIGGQAYALEAARRMTCAALEAGEEPAVLSALMKYQSTERMRRVVDDAMDVQAGKAICLGPGNYLWGSYLAVPVTVTVEGANILTRTLIVFGQGALRCHPWLLREVAAAKAHDAAHALVAFEAAFGGHLRYSASNVARVALLHVLPGALRRVPVVGPTARWFRRVEQALVSFALVSDCALLLLGGELKRREMLSGRFADIMGELYLVLCSLKRYIDDGEPEADLPLLDYVCANGLYEVQERLGAIFANFPSPAVATVLSALVFPFGMRARRADDSTARAVAELMLQPSAARDRLTDGIYLSRDPRDPVGRVEYALALAIETEALERKLLRVQREQRLAGNTAEETLQSALAAGIVTAEDGERLRSARAAIRYAIDVDDFEPRTLSPEASLPRPALAAAS